MKRVGGTLKASCCAIPRKFAPPCCSVRTYTCSIGVRACVGQVEGRERRNSAISRRNEQRREAVSSSSSCSSIYLTENVAEGKGLIAPNFFRDVVQGRKCPRGQWGLLPDAQVPYWGHVARNPSCSRFLSLSLPSPRFFFSLRHVYVHALYGCSGMEEVFPGIEWKWRIFIGNGWRWAWKGEIIVAGERREWFYSYREDSILLDKLDEWNLEWKVQMTWME